MGSPKLVIVNVIHDLVQLHQAGSAKGTGGCLAKWPQFKILVPEENVTEGYFRVDNLLLLLLVVASQQGGRSRTVRLTGDVHRGGVCC